CFFLPQPLPAKLYTLSLHDALPISAASSGRERENCARGNGRLSTRVVLLQGLHRHLARPLRLHRADSGARGGHRREVGDAVVERSEEHTSELQSPCNLVCRLLLEKK